MVLRRWRRQRTPLNSEGDKPHPTNGDQADQHILTRLPYALQHKSLITASFFTTTGVEQASELLLGDAALKVKRASIGIQQGSGGMRVNAQSLMAGTQAKADDEAGIALCLMNMITPEKLMDTKQTQRWGKPNTTE